MCSCMIYIKILIYHCSQKEREQKNKIFMKTLNLLERFNISCTSFKFFVKITINFKYSPINEYV